jgi:hypothetical protein
VTRARPLMKYDHSSALAIFALAKNCSLESCVHTVPVHLAERARLDVKMSGSDSLRDREIGRVSNANLTTSKVERLLRKHLVAELELRLLVALGVGKLLLDRVGG